jgi:hypothetical protein
MQIGRVRSCVRPVCAAHMAAGPNASRGAVRLKCTGLLKPNECRDSYHELTPFGHGGGTVLLEDIAAVEVLFVVEVIVD